MILIAVGTQFPFDRLVKAVDEWAVAAHRGDVIGQIGTTSYQPRAIKASAMIAPDAFAALQDDADVMIAHAGMGSILGALERRKPIIIMPRRHAFGEHRNDHQLATARQFADFPGVYLADDELALKVLLDRVDTLTPGPASGSGASAALISSLRRFVAESPGSRWRRLTGGRRG